MLEDIYESYPEDEFLKIDGFDNACIGVDEKSMRLIYSVEKIIDVLMRDMDYEQAMEYYYFNIEGAYMGEKTPIYSFDLF